MLFVLFPWITWSINNNWLLKKSEPNRVSRFTEFSHCQINFITAIDISQNIVEQVCYDFHLMLTMHLCAHNLFVRYFNNLPFSEVLLVSSQK